MPIDQYEDVDEKPDGEGSAASKFKEFDCPGCNANNPCDPPFGDGDELLCNYCGQQYEVKILDSGRPKFKEV